MENETQSHPFPDFLWNKMKSSVNTGVYHDSFVQDGWDPMWLLWGMSRSDTEQGSEFWMAVHALYLSGNEVSEIDVLRVFGEFGVSMY